MNRFNKDDIRTLIVVLSVCIICTALILILNIKSNSDKLTHVNEYNSFFSTSSYINKYINYTSNENKEAILSLLDNNYIVNNNINEDNLFEKVDKYPIGTSISVNNMEYVKVKGNYIYYVDGTIFQSAFDGRNEIGKLKCIIQIDFNNLSVSIYPIKEENYKKIIDKIKKINIQSNTYNKISNPNNVTKEQICALYLSDYIDIIDTNIDKSYELLSDDIKKDTNFKTLQSYKTYINNIRSKISSEADKCLLEEIKDKRVYSVIDTRGNKFVFNEEYIMNYKVDLYLKED